METGGRQGHYVALSHCWGGTSSLMTTSQNYHRHLDMIPFRVLPRTFQDAIIATRRLSFNYLWIDCLCIIQGDTGDWARECTKMTSTFQNASVTIAGAAAGNTEAGFLQNRDQSNFPKHIWEYRNGSNNSSRRVTLRRKGILEPDSGQHEPSSPLDSRAWILQEQLLCSRNLYFGRRQMYFECVKETRYEDTTCTKPTSSSGLIAKWQIRKPLELWDGKIVQIWYRLILGYTKRALTDPSDRLPALSGLAKWLWSHAEDDKLVAGLSTKDFHLGLSWFVDRGPSVRSNSAITSNANTSNVSTYSHTSYIGPTWSWVSNTQPVRFYHMLHNVDFQVHYSGGEEVIRDLHIQHLEVNPATEDPYGLIASATLRVRGRLKWAYILKHDKEGGGQGLSLHDQHDLTYIATFHADDHAHWMDGCATWGEEDDEHWQPPCDNHSLRPCVLVAECRGWFALVLEKCVDGVNDGGRGAGGASGRSEGGGGITKYRRVGMAGNARGPISHNGPIPSDDWFNDAERIEFEIV